MELYNLVSDVAAMANTGYEIVETAIKRHLLVSRTDVKFERITPEEEESIRSWFEMMAEEYREISDKLAKKWIWAIRRGYHVLAASILKGYVEGAPNYDPVNPEIGDAPLAVSHLLPEDFGYSNADGNISDYGAAMKSLTKGTKNSFFPVDPTALFVPNTTAGSRCVILLLDIVTIDYKPFCNQINFVAPDIGTKYPAVKPPTIFQSLEIDRDIYSLLGDRQILLVPQGSGGRLEFMPTVTDTREWHFVGAKFFERNYYATMTL